MHPFHVLLVVFATLSLAAFVFMLRWERGHFLKQGKGNSWFRVRISSIPIALAAAAIVIIPVRSTSGMEGLALFYALLLTIVPLFWFGAHWMTGRLVQPALRFGESALIAASPILLGIVLAIVAHRLQSLAWSMLRMMGLA